MQSADLQVKALQSAARKGLRERFVQYVSAVLA
jgi:hypothetical protein